MTVSTARRVGCRLWVYSSSFRIGKNGGGHCRLLYPVEKQDDEGANPKAFKYILIITGIVCLLIAPENLSTAMLLFGVVFLMMFIGRVAARKLLMLVGSLGLVGAVGVVFLLAIPKDSDIPFLHRFDTWKSRIVNFTEKEEVPAAKFDIDKDAQIAHARIAIARAMS